MQKNTLRVLAALCVAVIAGPHTLWALDETDDSIGQRHELREFVLEKRRRFDLGGVQMGAIRLMGDEVKAMPTVFGEPDVLRTLQATPGVQRGKNGNAGIMVRGGGYDQNTMMIDGAMLYSTEHMKGFVTAVNPDIVDNISFYRGAFPVQYAGRLSSVIDIEGKQGDFDRWHADASAGISMARVNAGGPIVRGKTSVEVAARMSYFGLVFQPIVDHHYKKIKVTNPYSHLDFWDFNAKLAQRLGKRDLVTLTLTVDQDRQNMPARKSVFSRTKKDYYIHTQTGEELATQGRVYTPFDTVTWDSCGRLYTTNHSEPGAEKIRWSNRIAALNWRHNFGSPSRQLLTTLAYSSYRYRNSRSVYESTEDFVDFFDKIWRFDKQLINYWRADSLISDRRDQTKLEQRSDIRNLRIASVMSHRINDHHSLTYGLEGRFVRFDPRRHVQRYTYDYVNRRKSTSGIEDLIITDIDSLSSGVQNSKTLSAFVGDEIGYGPFKATVGGNFTAYIVKGKTYTSLEPRVSLCFDVTKYTFLKASFSRMSQGERVLSSKSVRSPGDFWVTVTDSVPPMRATQYALSVNQRLPLGIEMSVEGYYKRSTGTLEFLDGVNFSDITAAWQNQVTIGRSRSWGVELMARRDIAPLTGWVAYTFARAHERYDTPGRSINMGEWFAAAADRPHNLQIFMQYTRPIKRHPRNSWDFAVHFSYMSGRKLTVPDHITYAGLLTMADHYDEQKWWSSSSSDVGKAAGIITKNEGNITLPEDGFDYYMMFEGFTKRFNYKLPDEWTLDVTVSLNLKHKFGKSRITAGVTNLFNVKNISSVYLTTDIAGTKFMKGVCDFPFMPVFSYCYSF